MIRWWPLAVLIAVLATLLTPRSALATLTLVGSPAPEHVETYRYNAIGALHTSFDPSALTPVTLDDQRPRLSGSGTAAAAIPNTFGGAPVTLDPGGRITSFKGTSFRYEFVSPAWTPFST